jgi:dihydrolipoamide dehydrogenase
MKTYDVIVIGAGLGTSIAFKALSEGLKVALIDKAKVGGTCLNVGCVPSKNLLFPADRIREIQESKKLGVHANVLRIDFASIMERMRNVVMNGRKYMTKEIKNSKHLDFYNESGHFIDESVLKVKNDEISGGKIFVASGARPSIPSVKGLADAEYLTNETVLDLKRRPKSLILLGGGYIAMEYGHFFAGMGTKVTIVQRNKRLVANEEPEISDLLKKKLEKHMEIYVNTETSEVRQSRSGIIVHVKNKETGRQKRLMAEKIMVATGRKSNADLLKVKNAGIETDEANHIKVDDYLQTNKENIWAFGDAIGKQMFTHSGDKESDLAWHNATQKKKMKMDFQVVPHAIFTYPQIASVGLTEEQARKGHKILVGRAKYSDIVKGEAMMEEEGFAKAIVEKETERILGFHIIGPEASILIQEVVNAMVNKVSMKSITDSMHVFPALSELIPEALNHLE